MILESKHLFLDNDGCVAPAHGELLLEHCLPSLGHKRFRDRDKVGAVGHLISRSRNRLDEL
jgi:hypothetical protein